MGPRRAVEAWAASALCQPHFRTSHNCSMPAATETIQELVKSKGLEVTNPKVAELLDAQDELADLRKEFHVPKNGDLLEVDKSLVKEGDECIYLCGNSLGLEPTGTRKLITEELDKWARRGVTGHFDDSKRPWVSIDADAVEKSAPIVGASPQEISIMNSLTINLHLLMVAFYRPTKSRFKIIMEAKAFPSDFYALCSQARVHDLDPAEAVIQVAPRDGENFIREEDICDTIAKHGDSVAVVVFSGVQFYNGQFFDIPRITKAAHDVGAFAGFDLAHAVGNVVLKLHEWDVDFACWCSYKYLNSGPGGIAGAFIHGKHHDKELLKFAGWWGVELDTRFDMEYDARFQPGVRGLQCSNPPVLQVVSLLGSLLVFEKTSMGALRKKSELLTGYLELLVHAMVKEMQENNPDKKIVTILTPADPERRGCQLSLLFEEQVETVFQELEKRGVVLDLRKPNVLRVAPVPLYNTFRDVYRFVEYLRAGLSKVHGL
eukprot:m.267047 g.267047  ORF g.267047 m.267047 type:complete len:489 (-) comp11068_c2_seq2:303-1769(-)